MTYTPDCKAAIDMARAVYNSLTEEEKGLVTNLAVLEAAEQARLSGAPTYTLEESRKRLEAIYQRG